MARRSILLGIMLALSVAGFAAATTPKHKKKPVATKKTTTAKVTTAAKTTTTTPAAPLPSANDIGWTEYGHDPQSTKQVVSSVITAATVATLHQRWNFKLAGTVVAQPLYYNGIVYAASEGGDVVAINASTGKQVWKKTTSLANTANCGTWGISSTPVIDAAKNRIYVAAGNGGLNAFDLSTGGSQPGFPFSVASSAYEYVWTGLRLLGPNVLLGVSSYCDGPSATGQYATGRLAAYNVADSPGQKAATFQPVTGTGHLGGIWGYSGSTISTDGGSIYTATGNAFGTDPKCKCQHEDWGYGDNIVQLSSTLGVVGANDPGIPTAGDDDWGAAPALFQPKGCSPLAVAENKVGVVYVYNQGAISAGPIWTLAVSDGAHPLLDGPAWSPYENMFYVAGVRMPVDRNQPRTGEGIVAIKVSPSGCQFSVAWSVQTGDGPQSPPIVVGNVVFASGSNNNVVALDAASGKQLWQGTTAGSTLGSPSEAAGMLFTPDGSSVTAWSP